MEIETNTNTNNENEIEEMIKKGYKICNNCNHYIPPNTYDIHTIKCEKLNTKCTICGELIKKTELSNHIHCPIEDCLMLIKNQPIEYHHKLYHLPFKCYCGEEIFLNDIEKHRNEYCVKRIKICQFCGLTHEAGNPPDNYNDRMNGYTEHEAYCGSKTIICNYCNENIRLKDIKYHIEIFHKEKKEDINSNNNGSTNNNNNIIINEWKCNYCRTINSDLNMSCSYCGNDKIKNNNNNKITSTNGYIKMKPETIKKLNSIYCSNLPCRNYKSKNGVAKEKGLCSECYKNIIYPNNDDEEDLEEYLYNEYKNQLISGCTNKECDNYFCLNGNRNFKEKENEILLLNDNKIINLGTNTPFNVRVPLPNNNNINDIEFLLNNMVDYSVHSESPVYSVCLKKRQNNTNLLENTNNFTTSTTSNNNNNNNDGYIKSNNNIKNEKTVKKNPFLASLENKKRKERITTASFF